MTEIVGVIRAQLDALLELLDNSRESHCSRTMEEARTQAREYVQRARRVAKERVHRAVSDERERMEREVRLAAAGLETEQRRLGRQRDLELIHAGWTALETALNDRWADADCRGEWARATVSEAGRLLIGRDWKIEHPPAWPEDEREDAGRMAREEFEAEVEFVGDDSLSAGLRIRNGGSIIDMSPKGILAHRRAIEAEILAEVGEHGGNGDLR